MVASELTQVILIRHGHTLANGSPGGMRLSGWTDTPLSDNGKLGASLTAEALRRRYARFSTLYTSPLQRARDTAEPISVAVRVPVLVDPGLREIFCGQVDGRTVEHVRAHHPDAWHRNAEERDEDFRWPGGESYREFRARCLQAVRAIASRHRGERVLVVTHAGVISQIIGWIHGIGAASWSSFRPGNASITALGWGRARPAVVAFDDREHLAALAPPRATSLLRGG